MEVASGKTVRFLKYEFSDSEKAELADEMARAVCDATQTRMKLKSVQKQINAEIQQYEAEIASCAEKLRSGYEMRHVDCSFLRDFDLKSIKIVRDDTGEIISERAMTEDEKQMDIAFEGPDLSRMTDENGELVSTEFDTSADGTTTP
jgi:uncharacterized FlaG/YvyC family protein